MTRIRRLTEDRSGRVKEDGKSEGVKEDGKSGRVAQWLANPGSPAALRESQWRKKLRLRKQLPP
eukprot:CAMPEP_0173191098 /NCGR_PEP_ID=MMETSP1141-20130122/12703_1 /TAXON_ID=483371 /ORGANISM="non described non described, Strain CCMP2298" /LENGTH=63 /DNA_ID=CAMNT_0014115263 /DNA_START=578 /DNA_END=765 /DNA_ORIENTATION=+